MEKIRVAIYASESKLDQNEDGYSVDEQIELIESKCDLEGKTVAAVYFDREVGGKSMENRYELQKMIDDIENNVFDEVIVWTINELTSNILEQLQIIRTLEENKVTFKSMREPYDTSTTTGKLMINMMRSICESVVISLKD